MTLQSTHQRLLIAIVVIFLIVTIACLVIFYKHFYQDSSQLACTMEAKICPNGSAVGRTGPNCEFAACPSTNIPKDWKIFSDTSLGVTFHYPEKLSTQYIKATDWPPKVQMLPEAFSCSQGGQANEGAGKTELTVINNHIYCATKITEGAAGSIYTQYAYVFAKGSGKAILTFSLRQVQCANYDEPQKSACEQERTTFTIDTIIDKIAQTLQIM